MEPGPAIPSRPKIARLPDTLINQIAAGEVVERPASVVKELVENSLDAEATRIDVLLKDGGTTEITILDDGCGMDAADLRLSIERHTTSKLAALCDLDAIATYGFRGEALSSIASVSELELRSRTKDSPHANRITIHYGEIVEDVVPVGAPVGTAITIRSLFERVPARQKYLRSVPTEFSHAARTLREVALGCPHAAFYLHHQGRKVAQYVQTTRQARLEEILRPDWEPLVVAEEGPDAKLEALLSPGRLVQDRGELFLFVNGRAVRNRGLVAAVRNAYLASLGPHHEPSGAIHLDLRPDWVDVNVHPQKLEVRCLRQETLYQWIQSAVRKALAQAVAPRSVGIEGPRSFELPLPAHAVAAPVRGERIPGHVPAAATWASTGPHVARELPIPEPARSEDATRSAVRCMGRVSGGYLVCEDADGVALVDERALAERRRLERLREQYRGSGIPSQRLAAPRILRVPRDLAPLVDEKAAVLLRLGIELELFGDGDVALKAHPARLADTGLEEAIVGILQALSEAGEEGALASIAQASSGGPAMGEQDCDLVAGLDRIDAAWTSRGGRPVAMRLDFPVIARHFGTTTKPLERKPTS